MAILELGIELNNIQIASKALDGLQKQLSSIGGKKIDVGASAFNDARTRAQEALAKLREYNLEQKKLKAEAPNLNPYQKLSRELTEMRNEAKSLGAQLILLEKAGMGSGVMANTLRNKFDAAQKEVVELDGAIKKLDGSLGQYNRHVGNYERAQGNANGVAMEFNRIIQDAPFGMMGIGNNIQQLVANWGQYVNSTRMAAAETGKAVTTMSLLKGAMGAILSPANLLSLGVAAVTSAWTVYTMWQAKANKEMKKGGEEAKSYAETLDAINRSQLEGSQSAQKELVQLQLLKKVYDDNATSQEKRKQAYNGIIDLYGQYFPEIDKEKIKISDLDKIYDQLSRTILATAKARAAESIIVKNSEVMLENDMKRIKLRNDMIAAEKEYERIQKSIASADTRFGGGAALADVSAESWKKLNDARTAYFANVNANKKLIEENNNLSKSAIDLMQNEANVTDATTSAIEKKTKAREKENKVINNYLELLKEINSITGLGAIQYASLGKVGVELEVAIAEAEWNETLRQIGEFNRKVLADTTITEKQRTELIEKANLDRQILEGKHNARMIGITKDYMQSIEKLTVEALKPVVETGLFEETKEPEWMKQQKDMVRAIRREIEGILNRIPQMSGSFSEIFENITSGLNDILQKSLVNHLGDILEKKLRELDSQTANTLAGVALAGNLISSMTSKSSVVGQGIGGALSGAASGFMVGGPIGAAIGGGLGLISGILGAGKRKKEEERQRQQLEEQKKTNALLERMNALAYTSQIIGGKTTNGIVTGVNRNEFGEITIRIEGRDLVGSFNRTNTLSGR